MGWGINILFLFSTYLLYCQDLNQEKIYYGVNYFTYKNENKGKLGEAKICIIKLKDDYAELYTYQRFITTNNKNSTLKPVGKIKFNQKKYTLQQENLILENPTYQYFTINNDTLQGYINTDYKKIKLFDPFIQISENEFQNILSSETFNKN